MIFSGSPTLHRVWDSLFGTIAPFSIDIIDFVHLLLSRSWNAHIWFQQWANFNKFHCQLILSSKLDLWWFCTKSAFIWFTFTSYVHLHDLLSAISDPTNVLGVEATVHVEEAPVVNCQLELPCLLPTTVEEDVAALETNLQRQTHLNFNDLSFFRDFLGEGDKYNWSFNQESGFCVTAGLNQSQLYLISRNSNSAQALLLYDGQ